MVRITIHSAFRLLLLTLLLCTVRHSAVCQQYPGDYTGHVVRHDTVRITGTDGTVQVRFYATDIVRVDFLPSPATIPDSSFVILQDAFGGLVPAVIDSPAYLLLRSGSMSVRCDKYPIHLSYLDATNSMLLSHAYPGGLAADGDTRSAVFTLPADLHFYGTGERGTALDKRGLAFESYNVAIGGYTSPLATMNINIPFLASSGRFAIYFDNTYPGRFDLGASHATEFSYTANGGELTFYVIAGQSVDDQLERYTRLTGRQPLPPRWAFGYIQSKYGYQSRTEAEQTIATMRAKHIPCDAIVLDLYWFRNMGDISWNLDAFPDPFGMVDTLLARGIKTILISEPYIVQYSHNFGDASTQGFLAKTSAGASYPLPGWWSCGCTAGLVDMSSTAAREWWWSRYPPSFGSNVAGFWTDLAEPERHPTDMMHALGSAAKIHNIYNFLWAQTLFDGYSTYRPDERIFNLTRSGFAGIQRYGAIPWSGDVGKAFGGLAVQVPMMLNMGMSGLAYHNSDIGGFCCGTTTPELYARWMQYGTFCPITRAHSVGQSPEPWAYGTETEDIARRFIELRYALLPYIYSAAYENYQTGRPIARPLFFGNSGDAHLSGLSDSYYWGPSMIVSPVVSQGQTGKTVYLPAGTWVDYWTDRSFPGEGYAGVATPIDVMPIFIRAGAIIPMHQAMQHTEERLPDTLLLACYPEPGHDGGYTLYEDDGHSLQYQQGAFAMTSFDQTVTVADTAGSTRTRWHLTVGPSIGMYEGKPVHRTYRAAVHRISGRPSEVSMNGQPVPVRDSIASFGDGLPGYVVDSVGRIIHVQFALHADSSASVTIDGVEFLSGVKDEPMPAAFELRQNYPNPFNNSTTISFTLASASRITLSVFDILGRQVMTVLDGEAAVGVHTISLDASTLAAGVYFYKLEAESGSAIRKFLLMK